ncbi:glutamate racemase [Aquabacterium sp. J223]|uniref:glutamate racemase n=1 Tax=Aquabacterium sp. J223 TaxID=2898431 RepID=UPI0021AD64E1|nr:glutamate racemase [Aquabacterium sp. J223]UUX97433.1 glutamate racemase [Aquabacterium sp. J223]
MDARPPACIGVFDSGVGGLSVLRALKRRLPDAPLCYLADSAHAPYGELPPSRIVERSDHLTRVLRQQGARLIVVACNTATAVAIDELRRRFPSVPFVGVEPGVKPATLLSARRRIVVLATPATVASLRLRALVARHGSDCRVDLVACPGLADLVEQGLDDARALGDVMATIVQAVRHAEADTVVLGCTHYPFVATELTSALGPDVRLVDTADAVAEQAARLWSELAVPGASPACVPREAPLRLYSSGDGTTLRRMVSQWLGQALEVSAPPALL